MKKTKVYLVPFVRSCESKEINEREEMRRRWVCNPEASREKRTRRVQLVLPPTLCDAARDLAEEYGISLNELIIRTLSWQCDIHEEISNMDDRALPPWEF